MSNVHDVVIRPHAFALAMTRLAGTAALLVPVLIPVIVTPWGTDAYNHVKALLTYGLAATALVGWMASYATSRSPAWLPTAAELPAHGFLLALLVSTSLSVEPQLSFFGAPGRYEGLFAFCAYLALYFVGVHFFGSRRGLHRLTAAAAAGAGVVIIYGLLQLVLPPVFPGEAFIRDWYGGLGIPRLPSTVGGPVVFGGYLALMLPLLFALGITERGAVRLVPFVAGTLGVIALVLTLTRGAWIAAAVGMILFVVLGAVHGGRQREVILGVLAAVILAAAILVTAVGEPAQIGMRVTSATATDSGSVAQRIYIWERTLGVIRSRPLFGWGPETLAKVFPYDRPSLVRYFGLRPVIVDRAHNDLLQVAVSIGVIGAAAYVLFWGLVLTSGSRLVRRTMGTDRILAAGCLAGVVAFLVQAQFSFSAIAVTPVVWLLAGAMSGWHEQG